MPDSTAPDLLAPARRERWAPTSDGLPRLRVVLAPLAALLVVFIALVAGGITGSSSGILNQSFNSQADPNHLLGDPQAIRSDEWGVNTSWIISQVKQGLPVTNSNFADSYDATILQDLPSTDWSVAFRPHLLGFFLLPLDNAMAVKWWLPAFALIAAMYVFAITLMPRRPVTSVLLALGFFASPFFQWWFGSNTHWPVAWALLLMSSVVWLLRSRRRRTKAFWGLVIAYTSVTTGMTVYVPFIVPVTLVAIAFIVGFLLTRRSTSIVGFGRRLLALWPVFAAGVVAGGVLAVWMITRAEIIRAFTATVYPGERLQSTGDGTIRDLLSLFAGPFSKGLDAAQGVPFGPNASEASTFILVGLFLALPALWLVVGQPRRRPMVDWLLIALLALGVVLLAFFFIPGWDAIAHVLFLDRVPLNRMRLAFGLLAIVLVVVVVVRLDERRAAGERGVPWWIVVLAITPAAILSAAIAWDALRYQTAVTAGPVWVIMVVLTLVSIGFFLSRRPVIGAVAFAIVGAVTGGTVNPVYAGVYDLNGTTLVKTMQEIDAEAPGNWVGAGNSSLLGITLVQSGLPSFNGVQGAPSRELWDRIDPDGSHESAWNRLGNVSWGVGDGPPNPINPTPDQIRLIFDSCETFAQENVQYVLSEFDIQQPCVDLLRTVKQGPSTFYIYSVVPRP
ncbi:hypothetical protein [uncultured Plantibacter sp.]|uniref:DUF7657 domain-containing protein n=1 Tax=uncultured Plantibacter sp. TaxID=293337 RepID=UPI0028D42F3E|nr:hypothetical protein [uncultured Plantibacter sp.]